MAIAQKWIGKGYNAALILSFVGLSSSTYYYRLSTGNTDKRKNCNNKTGRPPKGYSVNQEGKKIPDEQIEEFIMEIIEGEGKAYGYRKINACLRDEYGLKINHKKTYRLCKKLGVLHGYISGEDRFFFQFVANIFEEKCEELGITHERIPNKTPNLVAHIEAFHFILEDECYSWHDFDSFLEVYREVTRFMQFYNLRRKHGSLKNLSPVQFYKANQKKTLSIKSFSA